MLKIKRINLSYKEKSSVRYNTVNFPDGQISVNLDLQDIKPGEDIEIVSRMNSYEDLIRILSVTQVLKRLGCKVFLYVPCWLAQRSDRVFNPGGSFDLKLITDIINSQEYSAVGILHPHSDVLPALLNNSYVITSDSFIKDAVSLIEQTEKDLVLVSPDAGAYKTVAKIGESVGKEVYPAVKIRDTEGIPHIHFHCNMEGRNCLICDDICDGGRTFVGLAEQLRLSGAGKIYLAVTHGIFSAGFEELKKNFEKIYTTNSIKDIDNDLIVQLTVI